VLIGYDISRRTVSPWARKDLNKHHIEKDK
jgi:hypothetical protein